MALYEVLEQLKNWKFSPDNVELVPLFSHWWVSDREAKQTLRAQDKKEKFITTLRKAEGLAQKILSDPASLGHERLDALELQGSLHFYLNPRLFQEIFSGKTRSIDTAIEFFESLEEGVKTNENQGIVREARNHLHFAYNYRIAQLKETESHNKIGELMFKKGRLLYSMRRTEDAISILTEKKGYSKDLEAETLLFNIYAEKLERSLKDYPARLNEVASMVGKREERELRPFKRNLEKLGAPPTKPKQPEPGDKEELRLYGIASKEYETALAAYRRKVRRLGSREVNEESIRRVQDRFYSELMEKKHNNLVPLEIEIFQQGADLKDQYKALARLQGEKEAQKTYEAFVNIMTKTADMFRQADNKALEKVYRQALKEIKN